MHEHEVLQQYSTPGLRKCQLTRAAKQDHLASLHTPRPEQQKILSQLYGHEDSELHVSEQPPKLRLVQLTGVRAGNTVTIKPTIDVASHPA